MSKRAKILLTGLGLIVLGIAIFHWFPLTGLLTTLAGMLMISEIWVLWINPDSHLWSWRTTISVLGILVILSLALEFVVKLLKQ